MKQSEIQIDLSRKLQADIGEVLDRNARVAQVALSSGQVMVIMMEAAMSVIMATCATVAASVDDMEPGVAFDNTLEALMAMARGDRERALVRVAESRAKVAK